jgi:hypothetical protein
MATWGCLGMTAKLLHLATRGVVVGKDGGIAYAGME